VRADLGGSQLVTRNLEKQLATASTDLNQLQDHSSELESLKLRLEADNKAQAAQVGDLTAQLQQAKQEGRQLRTQLAERDQYTSNLQADHERQQSRLRGQRGAQAEELMQLRSQMVASQELTDELQSKLAEANTSRLQLQGRLAAHHLFASCTVKPTKLSSVDNATV